MNPDTVVPVQSDADYWDQLVKSGMPADVATATVNARRLPASGAGSTFLNKAASGAIYGLGDRLGALASSMAHSPSHDLSLYHFYLDALQARHKADARAHPAAAITGGLTGLVASPLNWLFPTGGAGALSQAARGAATGAVAGGVSGAADAPYGETLPAAARGAAFGAVGGAVLPAVASKVAPLLTPQVAAESRLSQSIAKSGGPAALRATLQDLQALGKGDQATLADLNPHLRHLAEASATSSTDANVAISDAARIRQAEQAQRVLADVRSGLGGDSPSLAARLEDLQATRRQWAASPAGFQGLRDMRVGFTPAQVAEVQPILSQPIVKSALAKAREAGMIGTDAPSSFQMLQDVKESLDDAVDNAFRNGHGNLGNRLGQARDAVRNFLTKNVPDYAPVAAEYAQRRSLEDALEAGAAAWAKDDVTGLQRQIAKLNPAQLDQFRAGMAAKIIEDLSGAQTNRDVAARLAQSGVSDQEKLKLVFGAPDVFHRFMDQMHAEQELALLRGTTAGSATARRFQQIANIGASGLGAVGVYAHNPLLAAGALAGWLGGKGVEAAAQRSIEQQGSHLAPLLLSRGPAIEALLARLSRPRGALSPALQQALGVGGGVGAGLLSQPPQQ